MSLKEFLREERLNRKTMREERKKSKKTPKTKREKVYKFVSIIFILFLVFGSTYSACSSMGGLDFSQITDLSDELKNEIAKPYDESLIFGTNKKLTEDDRVAYNLKLKQAGIENDDEENTFATSNFTLNNRELGALAKDLIKELDSDNKIQLEYLQIYSIGEDIYQKSIAKVDLSKYFSKLTLGQVYMISTSRIEILDDALVALSFDTTINNIDKEKSKSILDALSSSVFSTDFNKLTNDTINSSLNLFATTINCDMQLKSGNIDFVVKL